MMHRKSPPAEHILEGKKVEQRFFFKENSEKNDQFVVVFYVFLNKKCTHSAKQGF